MSLLSPRLGAGLEQAQLFPTYNVLRIHPAHRIFSILSRVVDSTHSISITIFTYTLQLQGY